MTPTISDVTVNGGSGFILSRAADVVLLQGGSTRLTLPVQNINLVAYQRVSYPIFLWVAGICFVFGALATSNPRPAIGDYEIVNWYWWILASFVAMALYFVVGSAAVVVHSGSSRTVLRGKPDVMMRVFEAFQPS